MTTTTQPPITTRKAAKSTDIFVGETIARLQNGYVRAQPTSQSRAALARLRRGLGKDPSSCPDLAEFYVDPDERPATDEPTTRERAAHLATGLYAIHQQSGSLRMHRPTMPFGAAVGLISDGGNKMGVVRRFQAFATANDLLELSHHGRGLVQLLRQADQGFDYGQLAADLVQFQDPSYADEVRMRWGRGFYGYRGAKNPQESASITLVDSAIVLVPAKIV